MVLQLTFFNKDTFIKHCSRKKKKEKISHNLSMIQVLISRKSRNHRMENNKWTQYK